MTLTRPTFKQTTLENGLTVIAEINPEAKSVALGYFCKTGSRDETPEISGVSHFLEHMLFKGTDKRDSLEVNLEFDQMGAQYNAFTSEENTVYYGAVLPEFAPRLLELWTDLMRPALRQQDFDTEKKVILEEIALYEDRPNVMLFDWGRARYFAGHPLGNSVLGTTQSISALTRDQMAAYQAQRYASGNLVLVLAGKVDWERTLAQVAELTASWARGQANRAYPALNPAVGELREPYPKATQTYLAVFAPGVSAQDPRRYAAHILANILGEEGNSRLHWALSDKGLVESVGAGIDEADQAGVYYIFAQTDPAHEETVKAVLREELERLEREGVRQEELERAKNKLATALVFAGETPMQRLMSVGINYIYNQSYEPLSEVARKVEAVTLADVNGLLESRPFSQSFFYSLVPA
ncbi:M16 family metallopeptidase [Meiothermus cerbereus]|uniref:M16 family metallopeptidase n=1 Tax=Meiothermus cerbereus TaxID=65552 RepID=UPI000481A3A7|nr:pitrilysin family protein [Meiothermus cerbereus]